MLIKINRINKQNISEEYINSSEILSCKKEKVIDKKSSVKCVPYIVPPNAQISLQKVKDTFATTVYKGSDGDMYVYASFNPSDIAWYEAHHKEGDVSPGWNKVEKIPEELHYEYWIEIPGTETTGNIKKIYWDGSNDIKLKNPNNKIQIDEETYNNIINYGKLS